MKVKLTADYKRFKKGETVDIHYKTVNELVKAGKAEQPNDVPVIEKAKTPTKKN